MKLHVLFLTALPMCLAQFSIQGPSDGNRVAQGLKYSEEKGIEYSDQKASLGGGDFSIQGATDGSSNFNIQGATDGHSNFQIQGPSQGGASKYNVQGTFGTEQFNIQGATDGHSQSVIQGPYDPNQASARALQYNDPSGYRVNWRSYTHSSQPQPRQQAEPQYAAETAAPLPVPQRAHQVAQRAPPQQVPAQPQQPVNYSPFNHAPTRIKELLQYQAQIPYLNIIPEPFRYDEAAGLQAQAQQVRAHIQNEARQAAAAGQQGPQISQYNSHPRGPPRGSPRQRRQAPQHPPQQSAGQQPYRRLQQAPAEPQIHYNSNVPQSIQHLLSYQAQIPYNIIANQIQYRPDKPYVPQPVQPAQAPAQQYQPQQASYSQGQGDYSQGQGAYSQGQQAYPQGQPAYGQSQIRPVNENNY